MPRYRGIFVFRIKTKFIMKTKLLLLSILLTSFLQAQTFTWDTATLTSTAVGSFVNETVGGVTCQFRAQDASTVFLTNYNQGTTGNSVGLASSTVNAIINFTVPVNIQNISAFNIAGSSSFKDYVFTPFGANVQGSAVGARLFTNASNIAVNWSNVEFIEVSKFNNTGSDKIGIDDITFSLCTVNIPDANFKSALVANTAINTNGDTEIQCSEANSYAGTLLLSSQNISDLSGIEAFTSVTQIDLFNNPLTTADFSFPNAIENLFLLNCTSLTSLDISGATSLDFLDAGSTNLSTIDVSNNQALKNLSVNTSNISSIDVSNNPLLETVDVNFNNLTSLDISSNSLITSLSANTNNLSTLTLSNGNNSIIASVDARFNNLLSCIEIDTGFTPPTNGQWLKDAATSYSDNCPPPCFVTIPDANFKAALVANTTINTNGNTEIECSEATAYSGTINVQFQNITDLTGIEAFTNITTLECSDNQISILNITQNVSLEYLYCSNNLLTNLDTYQNTSLIELVCDTNSLTSLNLTQNTALNFLGCYVNQITSLDVSQNIALTFLSCFDNAIVSLDISQNTMLQQLYTQDNQLGNLNLANGNNNGLQNVNANNHPNLSCIQIDSGFTPPMSWQKDATASYSDNCNPVCTVTIPDASFKAALLANTAINTNANSEIECSEAAAYTGMISVGNQGIQDATGIEAFTALTSLRLFSNQLSSIDVSQNINLQELNIFNNSGITTIDISQNTQLTNFIASNTSIGSLDVSQNTQLETLQFSSTGVSTIDITNNNALKSFGFGSTGITSIDLSNLILLEDLFLSDTQITTLDTSNNPVLKNVSCQATDITELDFSNNPDLLGLEAFANQLTSLNLANGNNTNIVVVQVTSNPNLFCIQIDAGFTPPTSWQKDATASYSDNCNPVCTVTIPDASFKAALLANTAINTNGNNEIECSEASTFTGAIAISNPTNLITDLTGLEAFTEITELLLSQATSPSVTSLDFSTNTDLFRLTVRGNSITSLNLSQNINLNELDIDDTSLTSLDLSSNINLLSIEMERSTLTTLDVSTNTRLLDFDARQSALTTMNLSNNSDLVNVEFNLCNMLTSVNIANGNNSLMTFAAFTGAPNLICIQIDSGFTPPTSIWYKDATASYSDDCAAFLSVPNFNAENFKIYPNPTTTILNIESNTTLETIEIYNILGTKVMTTSALTINVAGLQNGMYLLKLINENGQISTSKFIKQ